MDSKYDDIYNIKIMLIRLAGTMILIVVDTHSWGA